MRDIIERHCFEAHDDDDNLHTVLLVEKFDLTKGSADLTHRTPTAMAMETDKGQPVYFVSADVFEVATPKGRIRIAPDNACGVTPFDLL